MRHRTSKCRSIKINLKLNFVRSIFDANKNEKSCWLMVLCCCCVVVAHNLKLRDKIDPHLLGTHFLPIRKYINMKNHLVSYLRAWPLVLSF